MGITRRGLLERAAVVVSGTCVEAGRPGPVLIGSAVAETSQPGVSNDELMKAGPFPDKFLGSANAPITVVEYASMTCTHCAQFAMITLPDLKAKYIATGKVRYTVREFALDQYAAVGAMLARSAGEQYFAVVDLLLRQQRQWMNGYVQPLMSLAIEQFGFTPQSFQACLANRQLLADVKATFERAKTFGISSVPCFFVNGKKLEGYQSLAELEETFAPFIRS